MRNPFRKQRISGSEFKKQQERILTLHRKWEFSLGLNNWAITYEYWRDPLKEVPKGSSFGTAALTETQWEYMQAIIQFDLGMTASMDDSTLERLFVHEVCHVLLAEAVCDGIDRGHKERVVETLARAFISVRENAA